MKAWLGETTLPASHRLGDGWSLRSPFDRLRALSGAERQRGYIWMTPAREFLPPPIAGLQGEPFGLALCAGQTAGSYYRSYAFIRMFGSMVFSSLPGASGIILPPRA